MRVTELRYLASFRLTGKAVADMRIPDGVSVHDPVFITMCFTPDQLYADYLFNAAGDATSTKFGNISP